MTTPLISVVVPTIHRPELLAKCIDGVLSGDFQEFEVLVVDQSKDDRSRRVVEERFGGDERVRYLHAVTSGAARARNLGAERSSGAILAFIDDDAIPGKGWLAAYAAAFRDIHPTPGMVAGRIEPMWETHRPTWLPLPLLHVVGAYDAGDSVREFPPGDFPISANFALPRAVMREIGGFDERLGFDVGRRAPLLGGEDSHLGLKVVHSGRRLYYDPRAEVRHLVRAEKLSPRYLLRRLYWNGRTYAQLRRREDGDRRGWGQVIRDALAKRAPVRSRGSLPASGTGANLALAAAMSAFALGAAAETIAVAIGAGDRSARQRENR